MSDHDTSPVAVLDRVSILLSAFEGSERLTLSELSRRTGFPRSSTHRMLVQLVRLQWVRRREHGYELGMKMFEMGSLVRHHDSLHAAAAPILHQLHSSTGLVVHLAILDGTEVLYLEKIGDRFTMAVPSRVGGRQPAIRTALGKAILALNVPDAVKSADSPWLPEDLDVTGANRLRHEFAAIRERGVAHDRGENVSGLSCIAAAIVDGHSAVGAISVCGPTNLVNSTTLSAPVRMAARTTARRLLLARTGRTTQAVASA